MLYSLVILREKANSDKYEYCTVTQTYEVPKGCHARQANGREPKAFDTLWLSMTASGFGQAGSAD